MAAVPKFLQFFWIVGLLLITRAHCWAGEWEEPRANMVDRSLDTTMVEDVNHFLTLLPELPDYSIALQRLVFSTLVSRWGIRELSSLENYQILRDRWATLGAEHVRSKAMIYFLHVSKAGGTSFCGLAWNNDCRSPGEAPEIDIDANCWSRSMKDGPYWHRVWRDRDGVLPQDEEGSCQGRGLRAKNEDWTFMAHEHYLHWKVDGMRPSQLLCAQFVNLILLRKPIERVISHHNHMVRLKQFTGGYQDFVDQFLWLTNNTLTRTLRGEEVYWQQDLHQADQSAALEVLKSFDLVLIMEHLGEKRTATLLAQRLGWLIFQVDRFRQASRGRLLSPMLGPDTLALLETHNVFDSFLYVAGRKMFLLDLHVAHGHAPREVLGGCCGYVCGAE